MKILTVSAAKWGIQNVVFSLLEASADSKFEYTHLTLPIHSTPDTVQRHELLRERILQLLEPVRGLYLVYAIHFFWIIAYRYISDHTRQYDVIWLHSPMLLPLLPAEVGKKTVITIHGPLTTTRAQRHGFPGALYYRVLGWIQCTGIQSAEGVTFTVVQNDIAVQLSELGVPDERVHVIGNGVDVDRFRPDVTPVKCGECLTGSETTLLSVGRLIKLKRPLHLLEIFNLVQQQIDARLRLILVGDGPLREQAEDLVSDYELNESVSFLDIVDYEDMHQVYAAADVFVLPSKYEGEPLVLYEAMASGLPAVVATLPSCVFVDQEDCGIVVDFSNPERAASQLAAYLAEGHADHATNARKYVETHVTWTARAEQYQELFEMVADL